MSLLQTVLGPCAAASIQVADAHAHLWLAPGVAGAPVLNEEGIAHAELEDFSSVGGNLVVDCQPGGCGRDGRVLSRLSQSTGVAIVVATGFHLQRYYTPGTGPWSLSDDAARELFTRELLTALDEAPDVRAGVIKSAWTGQGGRELGLMRAALETARQANAAIIIHTEAGAQVEDLVRLIEDCHVSPGQVQISHIDKRSDRGLHYALAQAGYMLGYDTFLRPKYDPERYVWPLLQNMLHAGFASRVTLGLDLIDVKQWHVAGGPGLRTIPTVLLPRLRQIGAKTEMLHNLGGGNIARLLARQPENGQIA